MRDRIEELESNNGIIEGEINNATQEKSEHSKQRVEKYQKRLKVKEAELKKVNSDLVDQKNEVAKSQLKIVELEAQLRDANTHASDSQEQHKLLQSRLREAETEREILLMKNQEVKTENDYG